MHFKNKISRRNFLKSTAYLGVAIPGLAQAGGFTQANEFSGEKKINLQNQRLAVAMWDFSYMTRRSGKEAEYENYNEILEGFVERGYNCIRIDAFPHLIASDKSGNIQEEFRMLPQLKPFMWGNHSQVTINPRRDLIDFLSKCKAYGIRIGLSTWMQNDTTGRAYRVRTPEDMADIWIETLDFIGEHDLLDIVEWVDFCNEFPLNRWAPAAVSYINAQLSTKLTELHGTIFPYTRKQSEVTSRYMSEVINRVKPLFPELSFCFSLTGSLPNNFKYYDLSDFDCLESHIWLNFNLNFMIRSGLFLTLLDVNGATWWINKRTKNLYFRYRNRWLKWMGSTLDGWVDLANKWELPVYTSEAWGPVNWEDLPDYMNNSEWKWVFDICEASVKMAVARGWSGVCSSNFCQPHHEGFYDDISYHKKISNMIFVE